MISSPRRIRFPKLLRAFGATGLLVFSLFLVLDAVFPVPLPGEGRRFSVAVLAEDGTPLRGFPDDSGVWRYPVGPGDVSPLYLEALLNYEDRHFRSHPGINPWSLVRALVLYLADGRPVSGGSTLTMQVARILEPHERTIPGKMRQMFRAAQLEWHLSKDDILTLYLNYAPFGGPIEGVQAASFAYLGKSAKELSHAEAALLAVLPQAPSRLRPDRHPDRAMRARDKVLDRMAAFRVWDRAATEEAKIEMVRPRFEARPMTAPLLAERLKSDARAGSVQTLIDPRLQGTVTDLVKGFMAAAPPHTSAAALVVENRSLAVRAYVGSADFLDEERYGHVDMIRAVRSPGSTLKPFLYAVALEQGLIHSESLLVDAPTSFDGYRPGNFQEGFSGPVSVSEALNRSLNIPAVDLLDRVGPVFYDGRLKQGGLNLTYPEGGGPNLAMILGGAGARMEDLVGAYTALARGGLAGRPRLRADEPILERRFLSPGSAYIIRQILRDHPRTDLPGGQVALAQSRRVAWKTGTSYGFRDAWALGVTDEYTLGVWVGRPDGTPSPGQYGRATAAPLLFLLVDGLPRTRTAAVPAPKYVDRVEICWPLGIRPSGPDDPFCHQRRMAYVLDGTIPPTLPDRADSFFQANPLTVQVNPETGLRVDADCPVAPTETIRIARWPQAAGPWLPPAIRKVSRPPRLDPACGRPASSAPEGIRIMDINPGTIFRPQGALRELPTVTLSAQGGRGRLFWMLGGRLIAETPVGRPAFFQFDRPGSFTLTVLDLSGDYDAVDIVVSAGNPDG